MKLSQAQFETVNDKIDAKVHASRRGTPERTEAEALSARWEAVLATPQRTFAQREERLAAIARFATAEGLV